MKLISTFPARLKDAMGNMSVTELANALGISKQSISAYLNGKRKPKRFVISEMARYLGVDPAWLLGYDVDRIPERSTSALGGTFSSEEIILVERFRSLSEEGRSYIQQQMTIAMNMFSKKSDDSSNVEEAQ